MSCKNAVAAFLAIVSLIHFINCANILFLNGVTSPSHHFWYHFFSFSVNMVVFFHYKINLRISSSFEYRNSALTNGIAAHGHNVTVLSPDIDKNAPKGVHYINIEGLYSEDYYKIIAGMISFRLHLNPLTAPKEFNDFFYQICSGKKWKV